MKTLITTAQTSELQRVTDFVDEALSACGCTAEDRSRLAISVEEVFVNIASYAYPQKAGSVRIDADVGGDPLTITLTFSDDGIPFDPLKKPDADTSPEALAARVGGLGILMVKRMMDDVTYTRDKGRNVLTLRKRLE